MTLRIRLKQRNVLLDEVSKEKRRQHIRQTSKIIMLFGDSLADFASPFKTKKTTEKQRELVKENKFHFGDDWIILPNASYGTWSKD
ncbi:HAD family acid phosphatase [Photobacterium sp. SKA34]|uniref:HAD family acid phosphatase n=1 Tax=Photobacterium sp. SKA34 TaxID=121723 RepID=UPI0006826291|nr:HAD family acid phosphatase [Photobacterium sp. SKA34]